MPLKVKVVYWVLQCSDTSGTRIQDYHWRISLLLDACALWVLIFGTDTHRAGAQNPAVATREGLEPWGRPRLVPYSGGCAALKVQTVTRWSSAATWPLLHILTARLQHRSSHGQGHTRATGSPAASSVTGIPTEFCLRAGVCLPVALRL